MTDQPITPEQPTTPVQQVNWEERYKGQSTVINRLTAEREDFKHKWETALADLEQLRSQLSLKDVEKSTAVSERDKQLSDLVQAKSSLESEINELRSLKMKIEVARKIGRPDLIEIADTIPSVSDVAVLEQLMTNIANWGAKQVKEREQQLLSGITPPIAAVTPQKALPTTEEGWRDYIRTLPDGSKEKSEAFAQMRQWGLASIK